MKEETRKVVKNAEKAAVIAATGASVVVGSMYATPDELMHPKPLVMIDPASNDTIDETDVENQKKTLTQMIKQWLSSLPEWVRVTIGLPLWFIGWIIITVCRSIYLKTNFVWLLIAGIVLFVVLTLVGKIMFPKIPLKKFVNKYTVSILLITVTFMTICDYIFPKLWDEYETYSRYVVLFTVTISVACAISQYHHEFYSTQLVVSDDNYTFEN